MTTAAAPMVRSEKTLPEPLRAQEPVRLTAVRVEKFAPPPAKEPLQFTVAVEVIINPVAVPLFQEAQLIVPEPDKVRVYVGEFSDALKLPQVNVLPLRFNTTDAPLLICCKKNVLDIVTLSCNVNVPELYL